MPKDIPKKENNQMTCHCKGLEKDIFFSAKKILNPKP